MQRQDARPGVGEARGGNERAAFEGDAAGELGAVTVAGLVGAKFEGGGRGRDAPRAGFGHDRFAVGAGSDAADADDPAVAVAEHERALGAEFGVAKRFREALAVESFGRRMGPFRAGQQRTAAGILDLPDVAAPAETDALVRAIRRVGWVEEFDRKFGVGEGEHGAGGGGARCVVRAAM